MPSRKGSPNKLSATVKENIITVFNRIGGLDTMAEWARENLTEYYRLYAKLLPTVVDGRIEIEDKRLSYAERFRQEQALPVIEAPADSVGNTVQ